MERKILKEYVGGNVCLLLQGNKIYYGVVKAVTDTTTILAHEKFGKTCILNEYIMSISANIKGLV